MRFPTTRHLCLLAASYLGSPFRHRSSASVPMRLRASRYIVLTVKTSRKVKKAHTLAKGDLDERYKRNDHRHQAVHLAQRQVSDGIDHWCRIGGGNPGA